MKLNVEFELDNAAFCIRGDKNTPTELDIAEVKRILCKVAESINTRYWELDKHGDYGTCVDANGNTVGGWKVEGWIDPHGNFRK